MQLLFLVGTISCEGKLHFLTFKFYFFGILDKLSIHLIILFMY